MANTVDKVIKVADGEVGYLEKSKSAYNKNHAILDSKTQGAGKDNYTKYWRDVCKSLQGSYWCNGFINRIFVIAYGLAEAKKLLCSEKGFSYYTPTSAGYFKAKGQWHTSNPKVGDIIYFKNSQRIHHVGIVYKVDDNYVYTIEGNTSGGSTVVANGGGVAKKKYSKSYSAIAGYGRPKYDAGKSSATTVIITKKAYSGVMPTIPKRGYFALNDKGIQVAYLQKFLNWYGGYGLKIDSVVGTCTIAAIKKFQKAEGLQVDGQFGTKSLEKAKKVKK